MKRFKLTNEMMKFGLSKEIVIAIAKQQMKLDKFASEHMAKGMYLKTKCYLTTALLT